MADIKKSIADHFEVGNWLYMKVVEDGHIRYEKAKKSYRVEEPNAGPVSISQEDYEKARMKK